MTLAARGVAHRFSAEAVVLAEVDLRVERGEAVALLGANGAGKTTLLRILAGLIEPTGGAVSLDERPLNDLGRREIATLVSMVPQSRPPAFEFTALEFVLMGFHATSSRFSLDGATRQQAARDALKAMAVAELEGRSMTQLSGGEAQRVLMARTLASGTPYWLLDEPTANLDLRHQVALLDTVRQHCDEGGAALAIVHDPNLVERWFDRVVVLADGRVAAEGTPGEVLTADVFEAAFGLRMRYLSDGAGGAWIPDLDPQREPRVEEQALQGSS